MSETTKQGINQDAMFALIKSLTKDGFLPKHISIEDAPEHYEKIENAILAYEAEKDKIEPLCISAEKLQEHINTLGRPQGKSSIIEDGFNKASKNGMIVTMKTGNLPANTFSGEAMLTGKVIGVSVIEDRNEDIERQLIELNLIDDFDKSKADIIVELASDILSHNGDLKFK